VNVVITVFHQRDRSVGWNGEGEIKVFEMGAIVVLMFFTVAQGTVSMGGVDDGHFCFFLSSVRGNCQ